MGKSHKTHGTIELIGLLYHTRYSSSYVSLPIEDRLLRFIPDLPTATQKNITEKKNANLLQSLLLASRACGICNKSIVHYHDYALDAVCASIMQPERGKQQTSICLQTSEIFFMSSVSASILYLAVLIDF